MVGSWRLWLLLTLFLVVPSELPSSPPACRQGAVDLFMEADLIVEGRLVEARRSGAAGGWLSLKAWFVAEDVFKGRVARGQKIPLYRSCHDRPVPEHLLGYPYVRDYCPGYGLNITGVKPEATEPDSRPQTWLL